MLSGTSPRSGRTRWRTRRSLRRSSARVLLSLAQRLHRRRGSGGFRTRIRPRIATRSPSTASVTRRPARSTSPTPWCPGTNGGDRLDGPLAVRGVDVGVTETRSLDHDPDLAGLRVASRNLLDSEQSMEVVDDRGWMAGATVLTPPGWGGECHVGLLWYSIQDYCLGELVRRCLIPSGVRAPSPATRAPSAPFRCDQRAAAAGNGCG